MNNADFGQNPEDWNAPVPYDTVFAPYSELLGRDAIRLSALQAGQKVLDVGAGTGRLGFMAAEMGAEVLCVDFSQHMIDYMQARIEKEGTPNMRVALMDGHAMELDDDQFDASYSVLGLMLFADRIAGFREMHRTLKPGGRAVVVNWSYPNRSQFMQLVGKALATAAPEFAAAPPKPPSWVALADPENFKAEMRQAGFSHVNVHTVSHVWTFDSPEVIWDSVTSFTPTLVPLLSKLSPEQNEALRTAYVQAIREEQKAPPFGMTAEARIGVGIK